MKLAIKIRAITGSSLLLLLFYWLCGGEISSGMLQTGIAAIGLFAIFATLQVQNQPVLVLDIEPSDVAYKNGRIVTLSNPPQQAGIWFKFRNVGNSPAIIRRFNRQWRLVYDADDVSALKRVSLYGEHAKETMLVAPTGGCTDYIRTTIFDRKGSSNTLQAQESPGIGAKPVFLVSVEYEDLLGKRYISHMAHIVTDGKFHQIQAGKKNTRLNSYERKRCPYQS